MTSLGMGVDWMSDHWTIASALRLANGCIRDAHVLAESGSRNAAYLSQQAIEQVIRALATSEAIHIERHDAHQLDKIVRRLPDDHAEKTALQSLVWLEAYATTFRYTLPSGQIPRAPDKVKLQKAIDDITNLILRLAAHFKIDLGDESKPAQTVAPMRRPGLR
ncbi:HEPN domain-containing protein [Mesorhizobium sp. B2-3-12]|uniref:HEPN domain-containing protein n=1 Tax=Mesorhizobium sp. B2-3-12 TaxID=2589952 RepID=UPI00112E9C31|nr:HEPN domain-containing protein [Mesorhizobium sp. B2-3-12]TPL95241.1 HEPN domain-containing protein [Mesorhizobium sp. B2-3-12]